MRVMSAGRGYLLLERGRSDSAVVDSGRVGESGRRDGPLVGVRLETDDIGALVGVTLEIDDIGSLAERSIILAWRRAATCSRVLARIW